MATIRCVKSMLTVAMMMLGAGVASGQDYPNRSIRIITGTVGGSNDFAARLIALEIAGPLGQSVVVDNRPQVPAAEAVAKAPPDGYTVLVTGSFHWVGPLMQSSLSWDPVRDFSPITQVSSTPVLVVVNAGLPVKSISELIALAKAKPGALNYVSSPDGSSSHLTGELFKAMAGVNIVRIVYKGTEEAIPDMISGQVNVMFSTGSVVAAGLKLGKLKALAVTSAEPSPLAPGLPTVAASGVPGYESVTILAMFVPARTPQPVINKLNVETVRILSKPDVKEKFFNAGQATAAGSPDELAATIKSEVARWGKVIKDAGIKTN